MFIDLVTFFVRRIIKEHGKSHRVFNLINLSVRNVYHKKLYMYSPVLDIKAIGKMCTCADALVLIF